MSIYDWKRVLVATVSLDKAFGLNSYVVDLDNVYSDWKPRSLYTCELKDENNRKYVLPFRLVPPPETPGPVVSILVNPIEVSCKDITSNVVEFYGSIDGGKAPYTVQWYITNDSVPSSYYQPREEIIAKPGKTTVISVDVDPDYYVVMFVKDACGNLQQKVVNLTCEENRKEDQLCLYRAIGVSADQQLERQGYPVKAGCYGPGILFLSGKAFKR